MMNCSLGFHMLFDHGSEYGLVSLLDPSLMMLFVLIFFKFIVLFSIIRGHWDNW